MTVGGDPPSEERGPTLFLSRLHAVQDAIKKAAWLGLPRGAGPSPAVWSARDGRDPRTAGRLPVPPWANGKLADQTIWVNSRPGALRWQRRERQDVLHGYGKERAPPSPRRSGEKRLYFLNRFKIFPPRGRGGLHGDPGAPSDSNTAQVHALPREVKSDAAEVGLFPSFPAQKRGTRWFWRRSGTDSVVRLAVTMQNL